MHARYIIYARVAREGVRSRMRDVSAISGLSRPSAPLEQESFPFSRHGFRDFYPSAHGSSRRRVQDPAEGLYQGDFTGGT